MATSKTSKKTAYVGKQSNNCLTDTPEWVEALDNGRDVKTRTLFLRTYHGLDVVRDFLTQTDPEAWAYIEHTEDTREDGTPKEPHIHLLIKFGFDCRLTYISKHFKGQQTLIQKPNSLKAAHEYLYHKNHPSKHQYDPADVVSFMAEKLTKTVRELKEDSNEQFLKDLVNLKNRELAVKYGRDLMKNYYKYKDFAELIQRDDKLDAIKSELDHIAQEFGDKYSVAQATEALAKAIAVTLTECLFDATLRIDNTLAVNLLDCCENALQYLAHQKREMENGVYE